MAGADKEIYVVGCGPSLRDFDWRVLAGRTTIAVNGALRDVPGPSFFITGDSGFAVSAAQNDFWGVETRKVLVMREDHRYWPRVRPYAPKYDHRIRPARFDGEIGLSEADFATGRNSGFCGMQYAAILGARVIHLLGMDFADGGSPSLNYHGRYRSNGSRWIEFFDNFIVGIHRLQRCGVRVVNHSPISRLNEILECEEI